MIERLKRRFALLAVLALTALVALMVSGMNVISFLSIVGEADGTLAFMAENRGRFPEPGIGGPPELPNGMSPELPYESRYFSVSVSPDGHIMQPETSMVVSVDRDKALEFAQKALDRRRDRGFIGSYRYMRYTEGTNTKILFLDCRRSLEDFTSYLYAGAAMSAVGILVLYLVVLFFIDRILRPVRESNEKQKRFITDAGHEIRTPLTVILANAELLRLELGENESVEDIRSQAQRLSRLTGDLVELSRMEEWARDIPMEELDLSGLTEDAVLGFRQGFRAKGIECERSVEEGITVRGDGKSLSRLLELILDNALKYSPERGRVTVALLARGRFAELTVSNDTAVPVPEEAIPRLFDRFYRADSSRSSETGGFGIGLSVVRSVAEAHSAKVKAGTDGKGRFFLTVSFPL